MIKSWCITYFLKLFVRKYKKETYRFKLHGANTTLYEYCYSLMSFLLYIASHISGIFPCSCLTLNCLCLGVSDDLEKRFGRSKFIKCFFLLLWLCKYHWVCPLSPRWYHQLSILCFRSHIIQTYFLKFFVATFLVKKKDFDFFRQNLPLIFKIFVPYGHHVSNIVFILLKPCLSIPGLRIKCRITVITEQRFERTIFLFFFIFSPI